MVETLAHLQLKEVATNFLHELGCTKIEYEAAFYLGEVTGKTYWHKIMMPSIKVDVVGYLNGESIAVECGGVARTEKLVILEGLLHMNVLSHVYVLPYGENTPYEWDYSMKVCSACGHKTGKIEEEEIVGFTPPPENSGEPH